MDCLGGAACPACAENTSEAGIGLMSGESAGFGIAMVVTLWEGSGFDEGSGVVDTLSTTGTTSAFPPNVCGVMVMFPLYVPAASFVGSAVKVISEDAVQVGTVNPGLPQVVP